MRPLLVGMNNPLSEHPRFALYPAPAGCTGWRIWQLVADVMTDNEYLRGYERTNLVSGRRWSAAAAREAAPLLRQRLVGRRSIIFGKETASHLGLNNLERGTWNAAAENGQVALLPHPSGRNLWYNTEENRETARRVLLEALQP